MDHLWSPWRYRYVSTASSGAGCIFCAAHQASDDKTNRVLLRAERNFVLLNAFPYTSGHLMIAPYTHVPTLEAAEPAALQEMILLAQRMETALRKVYRPDGLNLGFNIGKGAGAGIEGHIHMHVLPRWTGDVNFMTSIGETRVLPEDLDTTYERLAAAI
ncbi:MAG TPA: HIT domain-containing protein [Bryobacteraceae bacterium]|nr:HIT domain-containing protein [Bryobacteraceae bacterium]